MQGVAAATPCFLPRCFPMNKKIPILICFALSALSCGQSRTGSLPIFNDYEFRIKTDEHTVDADSISRMPYARYFNNLKEIQVPLYRIVEGKNYRLYLGLPFHTSVSRLSTERFKLLGTADTNNSQTFRRYQKDMQYIAEYILPLDSASTVFIAAITEDSVVAATEFTEQQFKERIIK